MAGLRAELNGPPYREMGSVVTSSLIDEEVNVFADIHGGPEQPMQGQLEQKLSEKNTLQAFGFLT